MAVCLLATRVVNHILLPEFHAKKKCKSFDLRKRKFRSKMAATHQTHGPGGLCAVSALVGLPWCVCVRLFVWKAVVIVSFIWECQGLEVGRERRGGEGGVFSAMGMTLVFGCVSQPPITLLIVPLFAGSVASLL